MNRWRRVVTLVVSLGALAVLAAVAPSGASAQQGQFCDPSETPPAGFECREASDGRNRLHSASGSSSSPGTGADTSVITQADCNAGRIRRGGRTLTRSECEKLIGQRVNLADTGFEAWMFGLGGVVLLLGAAGLQLRRRGPGRTLA